MFRIENIEGEIIKKVETVGTHGYVKVCSTDGSKHCILPRKMADNYLKRIKEMEVYEDDIWVVTYAKCGTTWTQEMIWMLNNNLDYEAGMKKQLAERFPFIEIGGVIIDLPMDTFEIANKTPRPRHIKSHLPLFLLPDKLWTVKPKIIYVARNPKDVSISFYHHYQNLHGYKGTKSDFLNAFINDQIIYSPFNGHVLEFWKIRNEPNILFLFYEDMLKNLEIEVRKAMKFLGKNYTQEQVDQLCKHLSFESMRKNPSCNYDDLLHFLSKLLQIERDENFHFIRKGQAGSHREELTQEEIKSLDVFLKDPELKKCGFEFKL